MNDLKTMHCAYIIVQFILNNAESIKISSSLYIHVHHSGGGPADDNFSPPPPPFLRLSHALLRLQAHHHLILSFSSLHPSVSSSSPFQVLHHHLPLERPVNLPDADVSVMLLLACTPYTETYHSILR